MATAMVTSPVPVAAAAPAAPAAPAELPIIMTRLYNDSTKEEYVGSGTLTLDLAHDELLIEAFSKAVNEDHFFRNSRDINQIELKELLLQKAKVLNLQRPEEVVVRLFGKAIADGYVREAKTNGFMKKTSKDLKAGPWAGLFVFSQPNHLFYFDIWDAWLILTSFNNFIDSGTANAMMRASALGFNFKTPIFTQNPNNLGASQFPFTAVFNGDVLLFSYILQVIPDLYYGSPTATKEVREVRVRAIIKVEEGDEYAINVKRMNVIVMNFIWQQNLVKMFQDIMQDNNLWKGGRSKTSTKTALAREKFLMSLAALRRICFVDYEPNGTFKWRILLPNVGENITEYQMEKIYSHFNSIFLELIESYYKSELGNTGMPSQRFQPSTTESSLKNILKKTLPAAAATKETAAEEVRVKNYFNINLEEEQEQALLEHISFPFVISQSSMAVNIRRDVTPDMIPTTKNISFSELFSVNFCSARTEVKDIVPTVGAKVVYKTKIAEIISVGAGGNTVEIKGESTSGVNMDVAIGDVIVLDDKKLCVKGLRDLTDFFMKKKMTAGAPYVLWHSAVISSTIFQIAKYSGDTFHITISLLTQDARDAARDTAKVNPTIQEVCNIIRLVLAEGVTFDKEFYDETVLIQAGVLEITLCLKERPMAVRTTTIDPPIDNLVIGRLGEIDSYLGMSGVDNGYTVSSDPSQAIKTLIDNDLQIIENASLSQTTLDALPAVKMAIQKYWDKDAGWKAQFDAAAAAVAAAVDAAPLSNNDNSLSKFLNVVIRALPAPGAINVDFDEVAKKIQDEFETDRENLLNTANINEAVKNGQSFATAARTGTAGTAGTATKTIFGHFDKKICGAAGKTLLFPQTNPGRRWSPPKPLSDKELKATMKEDETLELPTILQIAYGLASIFPDFMNIQDAIKWSEEQSRGQISSWNSNWDGVVGGWTNNSTVIIARVAQAEILSKTALDQFRESRDLRNSEVSPEVDTASISVQTFIYNLGNLYKNKNIKYTNDEVNKLINISIRYAIGIDFLSNLSDIDRDFVLPTLKEKVSPSAKSKPSLVKQIKTLAKTAARNMLERLGTVRVGGGKQHTQVGGSDEARKAFGEIDKDGNGKITYLEMLLALRRDGELAKRMKLPQRIKQEDGTRDQFMRAFEKIDFDRGEYIDRNEFEMWWDNGKLPQGLPQGFIDEKMTAARVSVQLICMKKSLYSTYYERDTQQDACLDAVNRYLLNIKKEAEEEEEADDDETMAVATNVVDESYSFKDMAFAEFVTCLIQQSQYDDDDDADVKGKFIIGFNVDNKHFKNSLRIVKTFLKKNEKHSQGGGGKRGAETSLDDALARKAAKPELAAAAARVAARAPAAATAAAKAAAAAAEEEEEEEEGGDSDGAADMDSDSGEGDSDGTADMDGDSGEEEVEGDSDAEESTRAMVVVGAENITYYESLYTHTELYTNFEQLFLDETYITLIITYFTMYSRDIYPGNNDWFFPELHIVFLHIFIFGYPNNDDGTESKLTYIQILLKSLKGISVEDVEAGTDGSDGATGTQGEQGEQGETGAQGVQGTAGAAMPSQQVQIFAGEDNLKNIYNKFTKNIQGGINPPPKYLFRIDMVSELLGSKLLENGFLSTTTAITNADNAERNTFSTFAAQRWALEPAERAKAILQESSVAAGRVSSLAAVAPTPPPSTVVSSRHLTTLRKASQEARRPKKKNPVKGKIIKKGRKYRWGKGGGHRNKSRKMQKRKKYSKKNKKTHNDGTKKRKKSRKKGTLRKK
jgi:hypothetical protein